MLYIWIKTKYLTEKHLILSEKEIVIGEYWNWVHFLVVFGLIISLSSCNRQEKAQLIINESIAAHGWQDRNNIDLQFKFRDKHYSLTLDGGQYQYVREFQNSEHQTVRDVLSNKGFQRYIDSVATPVTEERAQAYSNSINSVMYFMMLPKGLNDPAVNKKWLKTEKIKGEKYDLIHVTFDKEGGGVDYEDEYYYWFNKKNHKMDYLAYLYHTDGGGIRFREAINRRQINGITIQDYINYEANPSEVRLKDLTRLYIGGELKELSRVINENVQIKEN